MLSGCECEVWVNNYKCQRVHRNVFCLPFLKPLFVFFPIFKDRQKYLLLYRGKNLTFNMQII